MSMRLADADSTQLRFNIGDRVECNCGRWVKGTIVKHFYVQKTFPEGMCAPYQVRLDDGKLIFAPADVDRVIRKLEDDSEEATMVDDEVSGWLSGADRVWMGSFGAARADHFALALGQPCGRRRDGSISLPALELSGALAHMRSRSVPRA